MPTPVQLFTHFAMGAVVGGLLALAMIGTNNSSSLPLLDLAFFVGVLSFAIGAGASMAGFYFTAIELDASTQSVEQVGLNSGKSKITAHGLTRTFGTKPSAELVLSHR